MRVLLSISTLTFAEDSIPAFRGAHHHIIVTVLQMYQPIPAPTTQRFNSKSRVSNLRFTRAGSQESVVSGGGSTHDFSFDVT